MKIDHVLAACIIFLDDAEAILIWNCANSLEIWTCLLHACWTCIEFELRSETQSPRVAADFGTISWWHRWRHVVESVVRRQLFWQCWASRWGGVEKMKKTHSRSGGVAKCENRIPTLGGNQNKKRLPCSMGVPKMIFATPLARERRFQKRWKFDYCEKLSILGGTKMCKVSCFL